MLRILSRAAAPGLAVALIALAPTAPAEASPVVAASQDPVEQLDELIARWDKAEEDFYTLYRAAETNEERRALMDKRPKVDDYLPDFVAVAESAGATDTAAKAWMWVLSHARQSEDKEIGEVALEALMRDHLASPEIAGLPGTIASMSRSIGAEKAEGMLRELVAKAPKGPAKGGALYQLALLLDDDDLDPKSERALEVRKLMKTVATEYADVKDSRGRSISARAEGWLFEKDHLQVGMVVPEIEAKDLSGVSFKLSDYRGKVVMLDFWGNW